MKAIKLDPSEQEAKIGIIEGVNWRTTRRGLVKPQVYLRESLDFNGVEVKYVTGNNAACVLRNNLRKGIKVRMIRSGDVIPRIVKVRHNNSWVEFDEGKGDAATKKSLPVNCPSCKKKLVWTPNKTDLNCVNKECQGYKDDRIVGFFKGLDTDYTKGGVVEKLINGGLDTIPKIVKASHKSLSKIEGFGQRKATLVKEGIEDALTEVHLSVLAHASGCFVNETTSLGTTRLEQIVRAVGEQAIFDMSIVELRIKLADLPGIGPIVLDLFLAGLPEFRRFIKQIDGYYSLALPKAAKSKKMKNTVAVWTGYRSQEEEDAITSNGGKVGSSVSKNTTVVFYAKSSSSKYKKAVSLGIMCVPQARAMEWLKKNGSK
jgi:DNA ligase (NAD+)